MQPRFPHRALPQVASVQGATFKDVQRSNDNGGRGGWRREEQLHAKGVRPHGLLDLQRMPANTLPAPAGGDGVRPS